MIFIHGIGLYGKVDHIPCLFYVATRFFYIQFIPLIPVGSYIVWDNGRGNSGISLGLSAKSVFFAWARLALLIGGSIAAIIAFLTGAEALAGQGHWLIPALEVLLSALLFYAFYASYRFARPGPARALALAQRAGIPMEVLAEYYAAATPEILTVDAAPQEDIATVEPVPEDNY